MKGLTKFAIVLSKLLEVLHFIGAISMAVMFAVSFFAKGWLVDILAHQDKLDVYGFSINILDVSGIVNVSAVRIYIITAFIFLLLMAMVIRNVYLIFKTSEGKTWFSNGDTPFQKDIVRMVREIGIFYCAIVVVGLIMSVIARLMLGFDFAEISVDLSGLVKGVLILCLSQSFAYGMKLQSDVDGLI